MAATTAVVFLGGALAGLGASALWRKVVRRKVPEPPPGGGRRGLPEQTSELLSGLAHDLSAPMTGILGYCDLALRTGETGSRHRADLEKIRRLAIRCRDLIDLMLRGRSRIESCVSLAEVDAFVRWLKPALDRHEFSTDLERSLDAVFLPGPVYSVQKLWILLGELARRHGDDATGGGFRLVCCGRPEEILFEMPLASHSVEENLLDQLRATSALVGVEVEGAEEGSNRLRVRLPVAFDPEADEEGSAASAQEPVLVGSTVSGRAV